MSLLYTHQRELMDITTTETPVIKTDYIPSVPILTTFREGTSDLIQEESLFLSEAIASQLGQKLAEQGGEA